MLLNILILRAWLYGMFMLMLLMNDAYDVHFNIFLHTCFVVIFHLIVVTYAKKRVTERVTKIQQRLISLV